MTNWATDIPDWYGSVTSDCMKYAAETGTKHHSTGNCCHGCRQRTEIDRGKVAVIEVPQTALSPQGAPMAIPAPKATGFWGSLFRSSEKVNR